MGWRLSPVRPDSALRAAGELASAGLRILATAVSRAARPDDSGGQRAAGTGTLVYTGLRAMLDPPRPAAAAAVAAARGAGIAVKMITGDPAVTAVKTELTVRKGPFGANNIVCGPDQGCLVSVTQATLSPTREADTPISFA